MTKTHTYAVAALIAAALTAQAGTPSIPTSTPKTNLPTVEGSFGVDVATGYTFKGVHLDSKVSTQPYLNLRVPLTVSAYGVDTASVNLATRQFSNPNAIVNNWYRSETTGGITFNSGSFTVTPTYHLTSSPNSAEGSHQAVDLTVGYVGLLGLNPHVTAYKGLAGTPGSGTGLGAYYEVGVAPATTLATTTVTLPINVGYGTSNLYPQNQKYGYTSVGVATKTPLLKNVSLNTGVTYFNTKEALNPGNANHWVGSAGVELEF
jgi:hypothetical protein